MPESTHAQAALTSISITPTSTSIPVGITQQFKATGTYSDGSHQDLTATANWTALPPGIATIIGGLATGVTQGRATIQASSGGQSSSTPLVVTPLQLSISVTPPVVPMVNGKPASPVTIGVSLNDCDNADLTTSGYSIAITGAGLTPSAPSYGKCTITSSVAIDPSAGPGQYLVVLRDGNTNVGTAEFAIPDSTAGPIPPGLAPEVDVMWEVMSQDNCSDVFGKRVAQSLYCIQLKIGNNSGHPIQIAGIGFTNKLKELVSLGSPQVTIANSSYASTRAILLQSQTWSNRNLIANSIQAAGLIMGGFVPFYSGSGKSSPNAKLHFLTATSIVSGVALTAFNLIVPDPTIPQLKSLDDESFRDNMIIPNNLHVQTVIFVEKQALTIALRELRMEVQTAAANAAANVVSDTNSPAYQASQGLSQSWSQIQTTFDHTIKNSTRPGFNKKSSNPLLVKLALGNVVIVGDEIEYLQRVQIQSNPSTAGALPLSSKPASLTFGDQLVAQPSSPQTLTITNAGSSALTSLKFQPSGANASDFGVPADKNTCTSTLAAAATCTVEVIFTPDPTKGVPAARAATLDVSFTPGSAPLAIPLTGNAKTTPPAVVFSEASLSFGTQKAGSGQSTAKLTIVNLTSSAFTNLAIPVPVGANATDFATPPDNKCTTPPAAGENCSVTWTFKPAAGVSGPRSGTVTVSYQLTGAAAPQTQVITLSGVAN
jgi:hypothetical protein